MYVCSVCTYVCAICMYICILTYVMLSKPFLFLSPAEGEDYRGQSFPVTFPPLTTSMSFLVPVISDDVFEPDEAFTLQLEAPQNMDGMCRDVRLGNPDRATIIIRNDDSTFSACMVYIRRYIYRVRCLV